MKIVVGPFRNNVIITLSKKEAEGVLSFLTASLNYAKVYNLTNSFMDNLTNKLRELIKKTWG